MLRSCRVWFRFGVVSGFEGFDGFTFGALGFCGFGALAFYRLRLRV